jgi:hypothetical protein
LPIALDRESLDAVLRASVLDPPTREPVQEPARSKDSRERVPALPDQGRAAPRALTPVPEPGTFLLVATGLAWTSRGARAATPAPVLPR